MSSLDQLCRLCLIPCESNSNHIDLGDISSARISSAVQEIFQILVNMIDDGSHYPTKVCIGCKQKTLDFYNYFTVVKSNQQILKNAIERKQKTVNKNFTPSNETKSVIIQNSDSIQIHESSKIENDALNEDSKDRIEICEAALNTDDIKLEHDHDDDHLYDDEFSEEIHLIKIEVDDDETFIAPSAPPPSKTFKVKSKDKSTKVNEKVQQKKYNKKGQKGHRSCDLCGASYEYRELLVTHMKRRHIFEDVECNICHKKFNNKVKLQSHHAHHNKKHLCEICSKAYVSPNQLKRHMQVHKVISNDFICSKCGEGFATRNLLADHVRKFHDGDDDGELFSCMCDICGKKFLEESSMNVHKRIHNPNIIKAIYCPVSTCGERMRDQTHLAEHMQSHSVIYNCSICARHFLNAGDLADHEKTHENEHRPHECQICNRRYSNKNQLNVHILRVHRKNEANLHECEMCSKTFLAAWELRVHERSHSNEKIAKCPMCERSYKSTNDIKKHMAVNHTSSHYKCPGNGCDKQFKTKLHFRKHFKKYHPEVFSSDTALKQYYVEDKEEMAHVMAIYARTFLNNKKTDKFFKDLE
uniref:CSON001139 protein n=1 Tax=Culicoides sonorensis TaxID=179676 RepID=A0A336MGJ8_CULSO